MYSYLENSQKINSEECNLWRNCAVQPSKLFIGTTFLKYTIFIKWILTLVYRAQKGEDRGNDQASLSSGFNTLSDMSETLPLDSMALGYEGYYLNFTNSLNFQFHIIFCTIIILRTPLWLNY